MKMGKTSGSVVTIADIEVEKFLSRELPALLSGSVVVGEEMIEEHPAALDLLDGTHLCGFWMRLMVLKLARVVLILASWSPCSKRQTIAGWIFRPVDDVTYTSEKGAGAFRNGERLKLHRRGYG